MQKKFRDKKVVNRLNELAALIKKHNYLYHTEDRPKISDKEYDKLVRENQELEKKYPQLKLNNSPTNEVGSKVKSKFEKSIHLSPMHSLANGFNESDLIEFDERVKKFLNLDMNEY